MLTLDDIKRNDTIKTYVQSADHVMNAMKYTEHGFAHAGIASHVARHILSALDYDDRTCELAAIAGYMHDIGNVVNRVDHAQSGAIMAFRLLDRMGMPAEEIAIIVSAIGNHDEKTAAPVNPIAAALIISDKSDVRRSRVRLANRESADITFEGDIHDRVNYACRRSKLYFSEDKTELILDLDIDLTISPIMEYFEIFMDRMILCRKAAETLGVQFELVINNSRIL